MSAAPPRRMTFGPEHAKILLEIVSKDLINPIGQKSVKERRISSLIGKAEKYLNDPVPRNEVAKLADEIGGFFKYIELHKDSLIEKNSKASRKHQSKESRYELHARHDADIFELNLDYLVLLCLQHLLRPFSEKLWCDLTNVRIWALDLNHRLGQGGVDEKVHNILDWYHANK